MNTELELNKIRLIESQPRLSQRFADLDVHEATLVGTNVLNCRRRLMPLDHDERRFLMVHLE